MLGLFSKLVFLGAAQRRVLRKGLPVFTYHRIGDAARRAADPYLYVSQVAFDAQLAALRARGYQSADLCDFPVSQGTKPAVITFDDAFCSVLENGLPPLAKNRFRAIQFVIAGKMGGRNDWDISKGDISEPLMTPDQIKEWLAAGHLIGSHSMTHPNLRHISGEALAGEVRDSKKLLEDKFGVAIKHFCYPYGSYNAKIRGAVEAAGYKTACTVKFGVNHSSTSPYEIMRIIPLSGADLIGKIIHRARRKLGR